MLVYYRNYTHATFVQLTGLKLHFWLPARSLTNLPTHILPCIMSWDQLEFESRDSYRWDKMITTRVHLQGCLDQLSECNIDLFLNC